MDQLGTVHPQPLGSPIERQAHRKGSSRTPERKPVDLGEKATHGRRGKDRSRPSCQPRGSTGRVAAGAIVNQAVQT